jgi:hypothetical protein
MGWASPDDPALVDYWTTRRRRTSLPVDKTSRWLLKAQDGRCAICGSTFLPDDDRPQNPDEWETWLANARKDIANWIRRLRTAAFHSGGDRRLFRARNKKTCEIDRAFAALVDAGRLQRQKPQRQRPPRRVWAGLGRGIARTPGLSPSEAREREAKHLGWVWAADASRKASRSSDGPAPSARAC